MSHSEMQASQLFGPAIAATGNPGGLAVIILAAATSEPTDLSVAAEFNADPTGRLVHIVAEGDIWYRWAGATGTVDETVESGANQGFFLQGKARVTERAMGKWFIAKSTGGTTVRVALASVG